MENRNFTYTLVGTLDNSVTDAEVKADGDFGKTVHPEICKIISRFGVKTLNNAWIDAGGKKITLPTDLLVAK
jgi:hypothetical protein